ncbi:MAG: SusC/RagA family TonB-linked outer membrane protein [Bacteroidetes bacterium]|nr:SusC/RagA family TonB-linked outer membrane protein [Bacteroidota bacterium]
MRKLAFTLALILFCGMQVVFAQKVVTGKVTDSNDGTSIPGVNISVKGTKLVAQTGVNGEFSIRVPDNSRTLSFSFVGYEPQDVVVGNKTVLNINLKAAATSLSEVVVTGYGIKRQAKELGFATAKVSSGDITKGGSTNVVNGLTAKVSGLQINTVNNGVNPDTRITLRGNRHLLASNQALVILDGVPVSAGYLNSINPNDIENVQILKGAGASAIYGNDASNGVMIVTTKKGGGKPVVKYSNTTTFEQISYMPKMQTRFGSGSGEDTAGYNPKYTFWIGRDRNTDPYTSYENQSYGPEYNGQMVILGGTLADGSTQQVPYSYVKNQKYKFFNIGTTNQNDVSYAVGDDKSNFYLSAQDVNTKGVIPGDKNRRDGLRVAGARTTGIFHGEYTIGYTQTNTNTAGGEFFQGRGVYWNVLNTPGQVDLTKYSDIDNNKFANQNGYFNAYYPNPYWAINHSRIINKRDDILGSAMVTVTPADWINISYRLGMTLNTTQYSSHRDEADFNAYISTDPWGAGHMAGGHPVYLGTMNAYSQNSGIYTGDFLITLKKKFNDFDVKVILGNSMYKYDYRYLDVNSANGIVIPGLYSVNNRYGTPGVGEDIQSRASAGVFGDLSIGYKGWLFVHGSGRNDWDSRLAPSNRSFFYPGADASIVLSELIPSLKDNATLSFAKVRGGWSKTGQVSLTNYYATIPAYGNGAGFPYGNTVGYVQSSTLSNNTLRPEITQEIEMGFELGFLRDRVHFETNIYRSRTKDQTIPASISAATGYTAAYINAGELETKGIETDLKITPLLDLGEFKWNFSINYSYTTNKVLSLMPGINELAIGDVSYAIVGQQFPAIKVSDVMRDPQGRIIVDPVTGYPTKNPALVNVGHGNPNHILGIVSTFMYKAVTLNIVTDYRSGNMILNGVGQSLDFTGTSWHSAQNGRQDFVIPNSVILQADGSYKVNTDVVVKNASRDFWVNSDYHNVQSTYTTSAAFWKLREVALTYDLPVKKLLKTDYIKALQIGLVGRNLLMFRPATNMWTDPEFNTASGNYNQVGYTTEDQTPPTRVFGFTFKLTF